MKDRLASLVERLGRPRIFVLGDLILDRFVWGAVERVSPLVPRPRAAAEAGAPTHPPVP